MFNIRTESSRYVWDIYAEIAANRYSDDKSLTPHQAADRAAEFADWMCRQRAKRFPIESKKDK